MSIENLAPYSPSTIYGQLTSPFTPKQITINAHTPYDKVEEQDAPEVFSRASFQARPQARIVYDEMSEIKPNYEEQNSTDEKNTAATRAEDELSPFSVSSFSDNTILKGALSQGYSVRESVVIQNAYDAYQRSALITKDAAGVLNTCSYRVF